MVLTRVELSPTQHTVCSAKLLLNECARMPPAVSCFWDGNGADWRKIIELIIGVHNTVKVE